MFKGAQKAVAILMMIVLLVTGLPVSALAEEILSDVVIAEQMFEEAANAQEEQILIEEAEASVEIEAEEDIAAVFEEIPEEDLALEEQEPAAGDGYESLEVLVGEETEDIAVETEEEEELEEEINLAVLPEMFASASTGTIGLGIPFGGTANTYSEQTYEIYISRTGRYILEMYAPEYMSIIVNCGDTYIGGVGHFCNGYTGQWCVDLEGGKTYQFNVMVDTRYEASGTFSDYTATLSMHIDGSYRDRAKSLAYDVAEPFEIEYSNDYQIYCFTAVEGSKYRFKTTGEIYRLVEVRDEDYNYIGESSRDIYGDDYFDMFLTPGEVYYIAVHGRDYYEADAWWYKSGSGTIEVECIDAEVQQISFTMNKTSVYPGFGDGVSFNVSSAYAEKVRVLVNGVCVGDEHALVNGKVKFNQSFHVSGACSVQLEGYFNGKWSLRSAAQNLKVHEMTALGTPEFSSVSNSAGIAVPNTDYILKWTPMDNAEKYCSYVFSNQAQIYKEVTSIPQVTIPAEIFETPGLYYVDVYGMAYLGQQSDPCARATIEVKDGIAIEYIASSVNDNTITWTAKAANARGTVQYKFDLYVGGIPQAVQTTSYSTKASFSYEAPEAGEYYVVVTAKDSKGTATKQSTAVVIEKTAGRIVVEDRFLEKGIIAQKGEYYDTIIVDCDEDWSVHVSSGSGWLEATKRGMYIDVEISGNYTGRDRSGRIVISAPGCESVTINVIQAATCNHERYYVDYFGAYGEYLDEWSGMNYVAVDAYTHQYQMYVEYAMRSCSSCGDIIEVEYIEKTLVFTAKHDLFNDEYVCSLCGYRNPESCDHSYYSIEGSVYQPFNEEYHIKTVFGAGNSMENSIYYVICDSCGTVGEVNKAYDEGIMWDSGFSYLYDGEVSLSKERHVFWNRECIYCGLIEGEILTVTGKDALTIGNSATLTVYDTNGTKLSNKKLTWKTSDKKIVTVNSAGKITAKKVGFATITVTDKKGVSGILEIMVMPKATSVSLYNEGGRLLDKKMTYILDVDLYPTIQLYAEVLPEKADGHVSWKSSNKKIATVSEYGEVTFLKTGSVNITATAKDGSKKSATLKLKVVHMVDGITISGKNQLTSGQSTTLKAYVTPSNASNKAVTWKSSNTSLAKVDSKGVVKAVNTGTDIEQVTITAIAKDGSNVYGTFTMNLLPKVRSITLCIDGMIAGGTEAISFTGKGQTLQLSAISFPWAASDAVSWSTSSKKIAKVSSDGTVTILKKGTVTITAKAKDGSGKAAKVKLKIS